MTSSDQQLSPVPMGPDGELYSPFRRRSLTLESHTSPYSGSSVGKCLERRRSSQGLVGVEPQTTAAESSCSDIQGMLHSCLAGNLSIHQRTQRRCFIEYGYINHALEVMILRKFGETTWNEIKQLSQNKLGSPFIVRMLYDDRITYNIIDAASETLGMTQNEIWEMFGESFFQFCEDSGYDKILQVLGGTLREFLENLDALHDHLSTIYPAMRPPSFRCSEREKDGALIIHYYSERQGLEHMVIGLVKTVARKLQGRDVNVEIISSQGENCPDRVHFLVTEKVKMAEKVTSTTTQEQEEGDLMLSEPKVSPATFCKAFPFHIMFNRELSIVQAGHSVTRVIKEIEDQQYSFTDIFQIVRPQIETTFENIIAHTNTVFVVRVRDRIRLSPRGSICQGHPVLGERLSVPRTDDDVRQKKMMRLKGQMLYLGDCDKILFLCSPSVANLDDLLERGLYLSDIPVHDSTRDLILLSEQFRAEFELTQKLEVMTDKLQQTYRELEVEKQLTDKLVYSILPQSVANKLRLGDAVEAVKYNSVTILFSGICDFNPFCTNNPPIKVVNLLNELYTKFDALADPRIYNVYKVETVGDKYMLASGLPEKNSVHAKSIALVALDMIDIVRDIVVYEQPVRITIGIHSGEVVAGVVGQKLPHYAVFGNTVCLASRMESRGLPDCINISEATYRCLNTPECYDSQFSFKERGEISVKGVKTLMKCYLLHRNLRKLPRVQMLLESGLLMASPCPSPLYSPQESGGTSASGDRETSGCRLATKERHSPSGHIQNGGGVSPRARSGFALPDPTAQTLLRVAANLREVAEPTPHKLTPVTPAHAQCPWRRGSTT